MVDKRTGADKPKGADKPNRINRLLKEKAKKDFEGLTNLVMVTNLGLTSSDTSEMRTEVRGKGAKVQVVRNRLTMRAFLELGVEEVRKLFDGPTAIIEAEDPVVAAKLADELCKKFDKKIAIVGGLVEGKVLSKKAVEELAKSKSKPELLAEISCLVTSPGAKLAAQAKGSGAKVVGAIKALIEKLEKDGGGAAAEGEKPAA